MCVICAKPAGIEMPKDEYIEHMWFRNPDGAGLMYVVDGRVHIEKGFMEFDDFIEKLFQLEDMYDMAKLPVVMHFRITKPENCHPFPISESVGMLSKLSQTAEIGVAHNGIIDITPRKGISDTMEYIISQLYPLSRACPKFYENKWLMQMVSNAIESKMAFLTSTGEIYTIGAFQKEDGILYSNNSYKCPGYYKDFNYNKSGLALPDGWEAYDRSASYYYRDLMWLDDGQYVKAPNGEVIDGDYAIDSYGSVYCYSYTMGGMVRCNGYSAERYDAEVRHQIQVHML